MQSFRLYQDLTPLTSKVKFEFQITVETPQQEIWGVSQTTVI